MRRVLAVALLAVPALLSSAGRAADTAAMPQPPGLIANVEHRKTVSLNGAWHYIVDPYDSGYYDYRHQPRKDGYFENAKAKTPQRSFTYRKAASGRVFLYIGAANYLSRLYVNGLPACEHEGGFTSFNCEVTGLVKDGDNFVVIYVNNQRRRDAVPTDTTDWWNYGGLTRDVELVEVPAAFLEDYFLQAPKGTSGVIDGWVKDRNANFARLAHYPHNRNMSRVADRTGLFLWSEIPVYWTIDWENPATLANARRQLAEMIHRDKNRASVMLWSVGNETPVIPARLAFMTALVRTSHELDPSRPVTAALETHYAEPNVKIIDDPLGKELDVLGCNEYIGWYERTPEDADLISWKTTYDKSLVMSEFGGDARAGRHGSADERWTEEYQENLYRHQTVMLQKIDFLRGTSPWILTDFRSPRRVLPGIQDNYNRKGLVSDKARGRGRSTC
jgi:beta-galactosidase/beta-glucuronidase